jgi:hypothetical protein
MDAERAVEAFEARGYRLNGLKSRPPHERTIAKHPQIAHITVHKYQNSTNWLSMPKPTKTNKTSGTDKSSDTETVDITSKSADFEFEPLPKTEVALPNYTRRIQALMASVIITPPVGFGSHMRLKTASVVFQHNPASGAPMLRPLDTRFVWGFPAQK